MTEKNAVGKITIRKFAVRKKVVRKSATEKFAVEKSWSENTRLKKSRSENSWLEKIEVRKFVAENFLVHEKSWSQKLRLEKNPENRRLRFVAVKLWSKNSQLKKPIKVEKRLKKSRLKRTRL